MNKSNNDQPLKNRNNKILIFGIGNTLRGDDGIGEECINRLRKLNLTNVTLEYDIQLEIEDSAICSEYDTIIFIDAAVEGKEPFNFHKVEPNKENSISNHSTSPEGVIFLSEKCFNKKSNAYILAVRGYKFDFFHEKISDKALGNLEAAMIFLQNFLERKE